MLDPSDIDHPGHFLRYIAVVVDEDVVPSPIGDG